MHQAGQVDQPRTALDYIGSREVGFLPRRLGIDADQLKQIEQGSPQILKPFVGLRRNGQQAKLATVEFSQDTKVLRRASQVNFVGTQQRGLREPSRGVWQSVMTELNFGLSQLLESGFKIFKQIRIAQIDDQQRSVRVADYLIDPRLRKIRMSRRQVDKLNTDVFEIHHARQGHASSERIVSHFRHGAAKTPEKKRLAAIRRPDQCRLPGAFLLDLVDETRTACRFLIW